MRRIFRWTTGAMLAATAGYVAYFAVAWVRYGRAGIPADWPADALLDRFMPAYEVGERHRTIVPAPADVTFAAACEQDLDASRVTRAIFKTRQLVLRGDDDRTPRPRGLVAMTQSLGWGVLAE